MTQSTSTTALQARILKAAANGDLPIDISHELDRKVAKEFVQWFYKGIEDLSESLNNDACLEDESQRVSAMIEWADFAFQAGYLRGAASQGS